MSDFFFSKAVYLLHENKKNPIGISSDFYEVSIIFCMLCNPLMIFQKHTITFWVFSGSPRASDGPQYKKPLFQERDFFKL